MFCWVWLKVVQLVFDLVVLVRYSISCVKVSFFFGLFRCLQIFQVFSVIDCVCGLVRLMFLIVMWVRWCVRQDGLQLLFSMCVSQYRVVFGLELCMDLWSVEIWLQNCLLFLLKCCVWLVSICSSIFGVICLLLLIVSLVVIFSRVSVWWILLLVVVVIFSRVLGDMFMVLLLRLC